MNNMEWANGYEIDFSNLGHADITLDINQNDPFYGSTIIYWETLHYGAIVRIDENSIRYRYVHSEDGLIEKETISFPKSFDVLNFIKELEVTIYSFNLILQIILEVEKHSGQWFIWRLKL